MNHFHRGRYKLQELTVVVSHWPWLFLFVFERWRSHPPRDPSPPAAPSSPIPPAWCGPRTAHRVAGPGPPGFESGRCNFSIHFPKAQRFIKPRSCEPSTGNCSPCPAPVCVNKVLLEHSPGRSFPCRQSRCCAAWAEPRTQPRLRRRPGPSGPSRKIRWARAERRYTGRACSWCMQLAHGARRVRPGPRAVQTPRGAEARPGHRQRARTPRPPGARSPLLASVRLGLWSKIISAGGTRSGLGDISFLTLALVDSFHERFESSLLQGSLRLPTSWVQMGTKQCIVCKC